jgi:hypothetical protein
LSGFWASTAKCANRDGCRGQRNRWVAVPVASAILTAIDPDKYAVIDFRALEALGSTSKDRTVNFYLDYLDSCRQLATEHRVTPRDLDRALWQWSKTDGNT